MDTSHTIGDRVQPYADLVEAELRQGPRTVKQLVESLNLNEKLVRDGLERLCFTKKAFAARDSTLRRRGTAPFVYSLTA